MLRSLWVLRRAFPSHSALLKILMVLDLKHTETYARSKQTYMQTLTLILNVVVNSAKYVNSNIIELHNSENCENYLL